PLDRALDGVLRHVLAERLVHRRAQARVVGGIAAAEPGGNGDLTDQLGEDLAALGVLAGFLVFDVGPFAVTGHMSSVVVCVSPAGAAGCAAREAGDRPPGSAPRSSGTRR